MRPPDRRCSSRRRPGADGTGRTVPFFDLLYQIDLWAGEQRAQPHRDDVGPNPRAPALVAEEKILLESVAPNVLEMFARPPEYMRRCSPAFEPLTLRRSASNRCSHRLRVQLRRGRLAVRHHGAARCSIQNAEHVERMARVGSVRTEGEESEAAQYPIPDSDPARRAALPREPGLHLMTVPSGELDPGARRAPRRDVEAAWVSGPIHHRRDRCRSRRLWSSRCAGHRHHGTWHPHRRWYATGQASGGGTGHGKCSPSSLWVPSWPATTPPAPSTRDRGLARRRPRHRPDRDRARPRLRWRAANPGERVAEPEQKNPAAAGGRAGGAEPRDARRRLVVCGEGEFERS